MRKQFRDFESAREFVRKLGLKTQKEWSDYCKSGNKPDDIPSGPERVYKNKGWKNNGDWIDTDGIANHQRDFLSYDQAKKFISNQNKKKLKIFSDKTFRMWAKTSKRPKDIPANPERTYKKTKEWKGWGDFLSTGTIAPQNKTYREFTKARQFVMTLKLKNQKEWYAYTKSKNRPLDIPSAPHTVYKKEWKGYSDWMGLDTIASQNKEFRSFESAKKYMISLQLKNSKEWRLFLKSKDKPKDIPAAPNVVYKNQGWKNLGDFLGNQNQSNRYAVYLSYQDAKKFLQKLKISSSKKFFELSKTAKIPKTIPRSPGIVYKKEWSKNGGWGGFLGTGTVASQLKKYRSFKEAKLFVKKLELKTYSDWEKYCKSGDKPDDIPAAPWQVYREWKMK